MIPREVCLVYLMCKGIDVKGGYGPVKLRPAAVKILPKEFSSNDGFVSNIIYLLCTS
jgi:hypothetical protein